MPIDHFPLEAEISLTELRSEATLTSRLRSHHRLRIRRRNEVVGVLLDLSEWRRLVETVANLESAAEAREEEAVVALIGARLPGADERQVPARPQKRSIGNTSGSLPRIRTHKRTPEKPG